VRFGIEDDGDPVEAGIAGQLFAGPVASRNGLGIGLYQMGRLAAASGMRLHLDENRRGKVRFELVYPGADDTVAAMPPSTQPEP
jgi:sensor histidine kinase regulating citrate/malate metabolism